MRFLFATDGHFSTKRPIARTEATDEEYIENQIAKRRQMLEYAKDKNISLIVDGGDFFQYWKLDDASKLLIDIVLLFKQYPSIKYHVNIGNHDIKNHSIQNVKSSLIGLLASMGCISLEEPEWFDFFAYGAELKTRDNKIAVVHENIFESSVPSYMSGFTAQELADKMQGYDLFLCGHNHQQFAWSNEKQIVLNGGSIMRTNAKQKRFKPAFWEVSVGETIDKPLLKCNDVSIKRHYFKLIGGVSDAHLQKTQIETFVESTQEFEQQDVFDFRQDVQNELEAKKPSADVQRYVMEAME